MVITSAGSKIQYQHQEIRLLTMGLFTRIILLVITRLYM